MSGAMLLVTMNGLKEKDKYFNVSLSGISE